MIDERFLIITIVIAFGGSFNYIFHTIKGENKPNRITWFMWALMPLIAFFAMLSQDVGITALITTFLSGFIPLLILIASFVNKKAFWKITKFDWFCGVLSLAGVIAWVITHEGNLAILFAIFADVFASIPTVIKAYKFPETESWSNYFGGGLNALVTIFTLDILTFASVAWLVDIFMICLILFVLVRFRIGEKFNRKPA